MALDTRVGMLLGMLTGWLCWNEDWLSFTESGALTGVDLTGGDFLGGCLGSLTKA
jgi:hypothetical protein